jgi:5-methylcytosine-specific restriction endonuclease McrA
MLKRDGLQTYCRLCRRGKIWESRHRHWDTYRDANKEASRQWRQNHPESKHLSNKAYNRIYQEKNREKYREQSKAYYEANRDRLKEQKHIYRRNNLEAYAVREANRRAHKARAGGSFTQQEWHELCAYYEYTCLRCGRQEPDIELTVDHVVPLSRGGTNDIDNLQPLCRACNTSKHAKAIDYRPYFRR